MAPKRPPPPKAPEPLAAQAPPPRQPPSPATHICRDCGARFPAEVEICSECQSFRIAPINKGAKPRVEVLDVMDVVAEETTERASSGFASIDEVLGGGFVEGGAYLVYGDAGLGKSSLLGQIVYRVAKTGQGVLYISGEESREQVAMRSRRLGVKSRGVSIVATNALDEALWAIRATRPDFIVLDSIQTISDESIQASEGTPGQLRAVMAKLGRTTREMGATLVLVGHVTKDLAAAGPKALEHLVDALLMLSGNRAGGLRSLTGIKNRFGATGISASFEMTAEGLREVPDEQTAMLRERAAGEPGSVVYPHLLLDRPVLIEIEARVAPLPVEGTPRRDVLHLAGGRLPRLLAILEHDAGIALAGRDVDVAANVAQDGDVADPSVDLAASLAIASSALAIPLPPGLVACGNVAISGRVKSVVRARSRLDAAFAQGFAEALVPREQANYRDAPKGMRLHPIGHLRELGSWLETMRPRTPGHATKKSDDTRNTA